MDTLFTGVTTKESNPFRNSVPVNDSLFKFIIKCCTNTLPTEGNIHDWTGNGDCSCKHCRDGKETLHHLLNNCKRKMQFYTYRHNIVAGIIRDAIRTKINHEYYKRIFPSLTDRYNKWKSYRRNLTKQHTLKTRYHILGC